MYSKTQVVRAFSIFLPILFVSAGLTLYSETMQDNLSLYWQLNATLGKGWADFMLGNVGDLMTPIGVGAFAGFFAFCVSGLSRQNAERICYWFAVGFCCFTSLFYMVAELTTLAGPTPQCGTSGGWCQTDPADFLAFSAPMIALVIWLLLRRRNGR